MNVVRISLYTALVLIATIVLQVYTPATRGYFNLGEVAIYTIAALTSPLTAGIAGGVGSALADLISGYGIFAPGTLVIKFTEGFVASMLISSFRKRLGVFLRLRAASLVMGVLLGGLIAGLGVVLFTGEVELYSVPLSVMGFEVTVLSARLSLATWFWILVGLAIAVSVAYLVVRARSESLSFVVPVLLSGLIMVTGYFLYEYFVSNPLQGIPPEEAFVEVPVNLGQALVGLTLSSPVITFVNRARG
ncbi:MAG: ECF transporter S component [Thermoprotei archaeon]